MLGKNFSVKITACQPGKSLKGDLQLPGDKSISHRSAIIGALGNGKSILRNYSSAADCQSTLECLNGLGINTSIEPDKIIIVGAGLDGLQKPDRILDVGNSGTTIRLLSGVLAGQNFTSTITGDESIQRRPMKRVIDPLKLMGINIEANENNYAPMTIHGSKLSAMDYAPPVASAQVKSCVLLAGLFADGKTTVIEKTPTRNHTEIMLSECGAEIEVDGDRITITGRPSLQPLNDYTVAGDLSSAAFFIIAALITPDSEIRLRHIGFNPTRTALIDVLKNLGASIDIENFRYVHGEPVADIVARSSSLKGDGELSGAVVANLIDEIPILAVAATQLDGSLTVRGAAELRVKESDRIRSIVENLKLMGIDIEEFQDGFKIIGRQQLQAATVNSYHDHRIAMSFAVAALIAHGETVIDNAEAASVSLPEFYNLMEICGASIHY